MSRVTRPATVSCASTMENARLPARRSSPSPATVQAIILVSTVRNVSTTVRMEPVNSTPATRAFTPVATQNYPVASADSASPRPSASSLPALNAPVPEVTGSMTIVSHSMANVLSALTVVMITAEIMATAPTARIHMVLHCAPVLGSSLGHFARPPAVTAILMERKTVLRVDRVTRVPARMTGLVIDVT